MLSVPYISQLEPGALAKNNDCGPTCCAMIIMAYSHSTLTVDGLYKQAGINSDQYLSASQLRSILAMNRISSVWYTGWKLGDLYESLVARKPTTLLINYGILSRAGLTESRFAGAHFVLAVGIDDENVYVNDPLYRGTGGFKKAYPAKIFNDAWQSCNVQGNPNGGALQVTKPFTGETSNALFTVRLLMNMNVRNGPGINYRDIGDLSKGAELDILETSGNDWGRFSDGSWVCITPNYAVRI